MGRPAARDGGARAHALGRTGSARARARDPAFEYSNVGYALLGRVVSNVACLPAHGIRAAGIPAASRDDFHRLRPRARAGELRAAGDRHDNGVWAEEPAQGAGAFAAMGGLATSAADYARFVAWLLAAWPPRDRRRRSDPCAARAAARSRAPKRLPPPSTQRLARAARLLRARRRGLLRLVSSASTSRTRAGCRATAPTCCCCPSAVSACSRSRISPTACRGA